MKVGKLFIHMHAPCWWSMLLQFNSCASEYYAGSSLFISWSVFQYKSLLLHIIIILYWCYMETKTPKLDTDESLILISWCFVTNPGRPVIKFWDDSMWNIHSLLTIKKGLNVLVVSLITSQSGDSWSSHTQMGVVYSVYALFLLSSDAL